MKYMIKYFIYFCLIVAIPDHAFAQANKTKRQKEAENTIYLDLKYGRVIIKLLPDVAPKHVERMKTLTRQKFYNGLKFHRVIDGFMAQTGDPTGTGMGKSHLPDLAAEFNKEKFFHRGAVGAARGMDINSANSQFFITLEAAPWLNQKYTILGTVVFGMKYVDQIKTGDPKTGIVKDPDIILKMQIVAEAE
ncbi:MAG: peptidylprolyl isomerase [Pseudomonadota bacterium]